MLKRSITALLLVCVLVGCSGESPQSSKPSTPAQEQLPTLPTTCLIVEDADISAVLDLSYDSQIFNSECTYKNDELGALRITLEIIRTGAASPTFKEFQSSFVSDLDAPKTNTVVAKGVGDESFLAIGPLVGNDQIQLRGGASTEDKRISLNVSQSKDMSAKDLRRIGEQILSLAVDKTDELGL